MYLVDVHNCLLAWNMHLPWVFCLQNPFIETANSDVDADVADDMKHVPAEIVAWFIDYKMF